MTSRLVLVTGASSGIGEATARRYGASGAHVLLLARNAGRLDEVVEGHSQGRWDGDGLSGRSRRRLGAIEEVSARIDPRGRAPPTF